LSEAEACLDGSKVAE
jgi:hypothetical protein